MPTQSAEAIPEEKIIVITEPKKSEGTSTFNEPGAETALAIKEEPEEKLTTKKHDEDATIEEEPGGENKAFAIGEETRGAGKAIAIEEEPGGENNAFGTGEELVRSRARS